MREIASKILLGILVSAFVYPVDFTFLPYGVNTKIMLALVGIVIYAIDSIRDRSLRVPKDLVISAIIAASFSLSCLVSIILNGTDDTTYSRYIMSFLVWTFAAFTLCYIIRRHYGEVNLKILTNYLTAVAVAQCVLAQMIDLIPSLGRLVDAVIAQGQDSLHEMARLYGIGASLDSAGVRFAVTLVLLAYMIVENSKTAQTRKLLLRDYLAFLLITVLGNMIARTTTVGAIVGLLYIAFHAIRHASVNVKISQIRAIVWIIVIMALLIPAISWLYTHNSNIREDLRFAFEGFFNWVETGVWRTDSTDKLNNTMWIWPHDRRTWLIGKGLFGNWAFGTDIGYCRFILYCGLIGFSIFALFFVYNAKAMSNKFPGTGLLAIMLIAVTFIVWAKVSTDIYQFYALLFCADAPKQLRI